MSRTLKTNDNEQYTNIDNSNTQFNEAASGLNMMLDAKPSNMYDLSQKSVSDISRSQMDLSLYTDHQDQMKAQFLRQLRDLEQNVEWQLYDAHEAATIYCDQVTSSGFLSTRRFNQEKD